MLLASEAARALSSVSGWCSGAGAAAVHQVPDGVPPLRNLRSRGTGDCPVTAIMVTRCDGRDGTDVQYPPLCAVIMICWAPVSSAPERVICVVVSRPAGWHLEGIGQAGVSDLVIWRSSGRTL